MAGQREFMRDRRALTRQAVTRNQGGPDDRFKIRMRNFAKIALQDSGLRVFKSLGFLRS
jgi:hypothetical protein